MEILLISVAAAVGGLLAVQAAVNASLSAALRHPLTAGTFQLLIALAAVAAVAGIAGQLPGLDALTAVEPRWLLLSGLASPFYILAGIVLFPRIGALTTVALVVGGQLLMSVLIDALGLFGVPQRPVGWGDGLGIAAAVAGILLICRGGGAGLRGRLWAVPYGLAAGAVLPAQAAMNAAIAAHTGSPLSAATTSFVVACAAIIALVLILVLVRRGPEAPWQHLTKPRWWAWIGGLCAAVYVTASLVLVPRLGASVTIVLTVAGQQVASALIDHFGWLGMPKRRVTVARGVGVVLLAAGAAAIRLV